LEGAHQLLAHVDLRKYKYITDANKEVGQEV